MAGLGAVQPQAQASPALLLLQLAHANPQAFLQVVTQHLTSLQQSSKKPQNPAQKGVGRTQARPVGSPSAQGFKGAANARQSPNQGGYAGPGPSEMTNPGMAFLSMLLGGGGGGQPQMGTPAIGALTGGGMPGLGLSQALGVPRSLV